MDKRICLSINHTIQFTLGKVPYKFILEENFRGFIMDGFWKSMAWGSVAGVITGGVALATNWVRYDLSATQEYNRNILCADYAAVSRFQDIGRFIQSNDRSGHHVQALNRFAETKEEIVDIAQPSQFAGPMVLNYSLVTAAGRMRYSVELVVSPSLQITPTSFDFSGIKPNQPVDEAVKQRAVQSANDIAEDFKDCMRDWHFRTPGIYLVTRARRAQADVREWLFEHGWTRQP